MSAPKPLAELFQVEERFRRSVNLAADYQSEGILNGYVLTPLARSVLARLVAGIGQNGFNRAWSITGPYGAGKSACAVFICEVLGYPPDDAARSFLRQHDPQLYAEMENTIPGFPAGGFLVVPTVGSRQPLAWTILSGLIQAVQRLPKVTGRLDKHLKTLLSIYESARAGNLISSVRIVDAIQETARVAELEVPGVTGTLIVYDELGKSLEYAAINPEGTDVGLLQILAELASRSDNPRIALLAILHQAFEHYAALLSPVERREWQKVQGRFEDIAFFESSGQLLSLINQAIQHPCQEPNLDSLIQAEVTEAIELNVAPKDLSKEEALDALAGCAPLHPTVALVLGKLFRSRLAQNERSLFAFLSSGEPYGFQEFLQTSTWPDSGSPFYRLDRLYDYVTAALGSGLYVHSRGRRWAEIEEALDRLPRDADEVDTRVVKTIGMLSLLGDQQYLKPSPVILRYALCDGQVTAEAVEQSIGRLTDKGITVYRAFNDTYALWQGSDIDLDECLERGLSQVAGSSLSQALRKHGQLKPYIAKRHLHERGTFRYFVPWIVDLEQLPSTLDKAFGEADGAIVFVLPPAGASLESVREQVVEFSDSLHPPRRDLMLFAIPRNTREIRLAFDEVAAWEWVLENVHELEGDSVARRELRTRRLAARGRLDIATRRCFDIASSYRTSVWIWQGRVLHFDSAKRLAAVLSDACDHVFGSAPIVKNELINRRSLPSAAAAARRNLIERMLTRSTEERLGMEGYPPELSMYLSVLQASGLHQPGQQGPAFAAPEADDPYRVRPLWSAIDRFLDTTEGGARPVTELYQVLKCPPFGIKDGLLPVYLTAAMIGWQAEIALYENGTFVPNAGIAEYERLLRVPERFSLQRYRLSGGRTSLLVGYARLFDPEIDPGKATVLNDVRMLMGFASRLPTYTQVTDRLSGDALSVRRALLTAQEPQTLLFSELPAALGFERSADNEGVEEFLARLRTALLELQQAYSHLVGRIQARLFAELGLPSSTQEARQEIAQRAGFLQGWVSDLRLRAFLLRLMDEQLQDREWLESVAAVLVNKPPRKWNDGDEKAFGMALSEACSRLRRVEEIALAEGNADGSSPVIALGVIDSSGHEQRDLLRINPENEPILNQAADALHQTLLGLGLDGKMGLTALALLAQRMLQEESLGEGEDA